MERHLEDGDVILFSRQPLMAVSAKIRLSRTLRFNECRQMGREGAGWGRGVSAQPTGIVRAPSPPILAPRPPTPSLSTPPPQLSNAAGNPLLITLYGLDLWSLLTSWGSGIQALLEAQPSPSLSLQGLSAPGMCASQLLALNTTALLNTSLTAQELMPGLGYFAMDVAQLLRDYLNDSSIVVQVADFCASNRTAAPFIDNRTLVNGPWPTLNVTISFITTEPESPGCESKLSPSACRLSSPTSPLRRLPMNCSAAILCPLAIAPGEMVLLAAVVAAENIDWDSYLELFEAANTTGLRYCGGPFDFPVAANDNIFPSPCNFGPGLSTMTYTLRTGTTYWVVSTP
ncbi:hypothetical protein QJQ45_007699 [Haematococcus lacustris]|nr:hypothetical protein QJQ45_007699 [Haematococcus lacustris]